jgi:uncharacterized protein (TIGR00661 family)
MKILYGVVGEGMGHATRSKVILGHLSADHQLLIVASGKAHNYLTRFFPDVIEIEGLRIIYESGSVDRSSTFMNFVKSLPAMVSRNVKHFVEIGKQFSPDVVVSDFESFAYMFGMSYDIPVISIDNMQILNRCELDIEIPKKYMNDFLLARAIVKSKLPGCAHYMVTSFFFPEVRKERTSLYPPILRPEILDAQVTRGEHILVYQTSATDEGLLEILQKFNVSFRVYGFGHRQEIGNLRLLDFSGDGFVQDLASCRAVIATGGFSLMSESVYLGKPYLAVPVRKQFEQVLNSLYLEKLGYGEFHESLDPRVIKNFLARLDVYGDNLKKHAQDGNTKILSDLDGLLESHL